jgi:hypothetical protein
LNPPYSYIPSTLLLGDADVVREHSFTRWMSRDLSQASADFCKNLGLYPAYSEHSEEQLTRYLFWRMPKGASIEVRTGREKDKFEEFDHANYERGWRLLSLHVNEKSLYSAVWISAAHFETARAFLSVHGIMTADRQDG